MVDIPSDLETVQDGLVVRFAQVAAGTLFAYDVLLNLDVELKYIWVALDPRKQPIKIGPVVFNLIYLVQRHLPLWDRNVMDTYYILGPSDAKSCVVTYKMSAWSTIIGIHLSEYILAMRVWAVWANKPFLFAVLVALALPASISALIFFVRFVRGVHCPELHMPGTVQLQGCFCSTTNKDLYVSWSMLMAFNAAGFILMVIPGFKTCKGLAVVSSLFSHLSILTKIIFQDGLMYYAAILMVSLINVVVILQLPSSFVIVISTLERVLHSIIASHVVLHIRKVAHRVYIQNGDTLDEMSTMENLTTSEIWFDSNAFVAIRS